MKISNFIGKIKNLSIFSNREILIVISFSLLFISILVRVYIELRIFSHRLDYHLFIHHFFWFTSVFLWFAATARYVLKVPVERLHLIGWGAPLVLIPVLHAWLTGSPLDLAYLPVDEDFWFHLLTLNYFHPRNHHQFFTLAPLLIITITASIALTRSLYRTLGATLLGFYASYIVLGLHLFGAAPRSKAFILLPTAFNNQKLLAMIYLLVSLVLCVILFIPEITAILRRSNAMRIAIFTVAGILIGIFGTSYYSYATLSIVDGVLVGLIFLPLAFLAELLISRAQFGMAYFFAGFYTLAAFLVSII
jgi:hypothetical protein